MDQFTKELLKAMDEAEKLGCRMVRFRQTAEKYGGVETAKEYLRRNRFSDGFDLLAVKGKHGALFTDDEINRCFERLCDAGYYVYRK